MSTPLSTPEDVVNNAIARLGYKQRIGSLLEGSEASKLALDTYSQLRDWMMRDGNWQFARRDVQLTLLKSAPAGGYDPLTPWSNTYPPQPWSYEYSYPDKCLRIQAIKEQVIFLPEFAPTAVPFSLYNDLSGVDPIKTIVCNVGPTAIAVIRQQVTNPTLWEPGFTETLCANLAKLLAPALQPQMFQQQSVAAQIETAKAKMEQQG